MEEFLVLLRNVFIGKVSHFIDSPISSILCPFSIYLVNTYLTQAPEIRTLEFL